MPLHEICSLCLHVLVVNEVNANINKYTAVHLYEYTGGPVTFILLQKKIKAKVRLVQVVHMT